MNATVQILRQHGGISLGHIQEPRNQGGVVLVIALIMLVAMTLAGIALVRSVDTSTMIAGNLAFKQSATYSGDRGVEYAITWLTDNSGSLQNDSPANGYYASSQDTLDLTGNKTPSAADDLDWSSGGGVVKILTTPDAAGNTVAYIINRMCNTAGPLNGATCATEQDTQAGGSLGGMRQMMTYQPGAWSTVANRGYYRITVRVAGPRNNVSYVQAIISL
jgi:Tfp pilus assembly protein PilX